MAMQWSSLDTRDVDTMTALTKVGIRDLRPKKRNYDSGCSVLAGLQQKLRVVWPREARGSQGSPRTRPGAVR